MVPKTLVASQLAEAHRLAQAKLGGSTVALMFTTWKLLDPTRLDATVADWLTVTIPLIQRQRDASTLLAANYLTVARAAELGSSFPAVFPPPAPVEAVATSLTVTGPVSIKAAMIRGVALKVATDNAFVRSSGVAMRTALNGGRETVLATAKADPRAVGWQRDTSGKACDFCVLLQNRGFVYTEATSSFETHEHCSCSSSPAYH